MKRDWELLRWILNEAESCPAGYPIVLTIGIYGGRHYPLNIGEHNFEEVYEHIQCLGDSSLVKLRDFGSTQIGPAGIVIDRLTMAGHDFLEAARNDTAWNKTKEVAKKAGGMSLDVFKGVLIGYCKAEVSKYTGLNM